MEFDKDLAARQEARELARQANLAQERLAEFTQEQLDKIVEAVAAAFSREAVTLAEEAAISATRRPKTTSRRKRFSPPLKI